MEPKDLERITRIQASLGENQLDAYIFFHPDNILMATGMLPGSTHVVALVSADGKVVVVTPWWRESFVQQECWADEVLTFDWCRGFNGVEPISAIRKTLEKVCKGFGLEKIGYDAKMHHYSPNKLPSELFVYEEIKDLLPGIFGSVIDATDA